MVYIRNIADHVNTTVTLKGWVANKRESKGIIFLVFRDGTGFIQAVIAQDVVGEAMFASAQKLSLESALSITGKVVKDDRQIGGHEIQVSALEVIHYAEEYPIAKKEHGAEFLMDHRHLWLRSRRQWAIMRVRNGIIYAIHRFFQGKGFVQMDAPIITGNACEGTTDLFEVDYFGQPAYLSQSGQLYGEAMAMAQGLIYTFGPTFRAEKSKTRRHLAEFWMIEPEMAFYDNEMNMDLIEEFIRYVVQTVTREHRSELELLERDTRVFDNIHKPFPRITYDDAVKILRGEKAVNNKYTLEELENDLKNIDQEIEEKKAEIVEREARLNAGMKKGARNFNINRIARLRHEIHELEERKKNIPQWIESARNFTYGNDFGGSDETVLTRLFDVPIMVYNWPKEVKAFYMKRHETNPDLVKGVDVLAPEGYGEIVGGGERETNLQYLIEQIEHHQLPREAFEWYLDLRRYGSVPHAGFGLGLERFVVWICGLQHIREAIPLPRMYGRLFP